MTIDIQSIRDLPLEQLRMLAAQHNIPVHHRTGADKIADLIINAITHPMVEQAAQQPEPTKQQQKMILQNEEATRKIIAPFMKDGFDVKFPGDDTVIMTYNGAQESIHLSSSPTRIAECARSVSRGARKPFVMNKHFGDMPTNALSAYTSTVL